MSEPRNRPSPAGEPGKPRLLDRVRLAIHMRHYSRRTEEAYVFWIRRFLAFHGMRHPDTMGSAEVGSFLSDLATRRRVSASTQNQAFSAILFLYRRVQGRELAGLENVPRAKRPERVPVVLSREEVGEILVRLDGSPRGATVCQEVAPGVHSRTGRFAAYPGVRPTHRRGVG